MQIRKLVKSGNSSLVTAIPRDWLKRQKLSAGDMVYIDEQVDKLIIRKELKQVKQQEDEVVIQVDRKPVKKVIHEITTAYMGSYKFIIIKGKSLTEIKKEVKGRINSLVALELVEESSDRIVARSFLNLADTDILQLMRRMDNIVRSMFKDSKLALKDHSYADAIMDRDYEVNRLSFLGFKLLKAAHLDDALLRSLNLERKDVLRFWELNVNLEHLGDAIKYMTQNSKRIGKRYQKNYLFLVNKIEKAYLLSMKAFYLDSKNLGEDVINIKDNLIQDIKDYVEKRECPICSEIGINAFHLVHSINNITKTIMFLD